MKMAEADNSQSRKAQGVQRVLAKLECSVKNGNYYEAHQMYRTLYFRFVLMLFIKPLVFPKE